MLHAQREGLPRAREEGVLDASRIRLVSEELQAFYVYDGITQRYVDFPPETAVYVEVCSLKGFT